MHPLGRIVRPERVPDSVMGHLGISSPKRILLFLGCLALALLVAQAPPVVAALEPPARRALFMLALAAALWATEAIPPFAVGILVIGLDIALLGTPRGGATSPRDWEQSVAVIGDPLVWLFFGGFVLAAGMARTGLDRRLARSVLARLGERPGTILGGVMVVTFALSMFMSNTATTAMMLAMLAPLVASLESDDPFAKALLLGTAVAANVGGMASLIGTPPNAIAVGALNDLPSPVVVDFLRWTTIAGPVAVLVCALAWLVLRRAYPARQRTVRLPPEPEIDRTDPAPRWQKGVVVLVLLLTVGLWTTSQWHPVPAAAVSFVPIVLLTTTGVLGASEIRGLNYDVLFLLAGGLALGDAVVRTGLSSWIVGGLPTETMGETALVLVTCYATVLLSNLMSNTAAANVLVPLGMAALAGAEPRIALPIAMSASGAMCLPVATPPNALASADGRLRARDFLGVGLLVGVLTPPLAVLAVRFAHG